MKHLTDDQVYSLSCKINLNMAFSKDEIMYMDHISECDDCYRLLCCVMAMQDISLHIGEFAKVPATAAAVAPIQESISTVIRLTVSKVKSLLEQIEANIAVWSFDAPLAIAGARSSKSANEIHKLEDIDNSKTFVAFDPDKKVLVIQIDGNTAEALPIVQLKMPDGSVRDISLEKKGSVLWTEVHNLPEGEYDIILKK